MRDGPLHTPPAPSYALIETSRGRDPAIVVVNTTLRAFPDRASFAWHLFILVTCELLGDNGMPTSQEVAVLERLEDEISSGLLTSDNAVFASRVTCRGTRELTFRVRNPTVADTYLMGLVSVAAPLREWEYRMEHDPHWTLAEPELFLSERAP